MKMKNGKSCYVEWDGYAAQWLRNLVSRGLIADGDVKECSVTDIVPNDLAEYSQVHLYAGIGVWSYSLRRAGIPDTANVWTFSEPCQPFSDAGKGLGFADDRYLRPYTNHLIEQCRPSICLGEQVASNDGLGWLDVVQTDMERARYACGALDTCSAGFGAPHIRQRLRVCAVAEEYLADPENQRHAWIDGSPRDRASLESQRSGFAGQLDITASGGRERVGHQSKHGQSVQTVQSGPGRLADANGEPRRLSEHTGRASMLETARSGEAERMADAFMQQRPNRQPGIGIEHHAPGRNEGAATVAGLRSDMRASATNGHWADADWLFCRDGKWRPVEPGTFPLAHGATSRVGRLRAYGNAVDAEATTSFCRDVGEVLGLI